MKEVNTTIVIPTFNRAKHVVKTIESALNQSVKCDIIVCDHGSRDNTLDVMKAYEDKVKYIRREEDFGPHFCWLEGVLHAKTEFVHLHYDDDLMNSTFIEETMRLMTQDVGMVFTDVQVLNMDDNTLSAPLFKFSEKFTTGTYDKGLLEKMLLNNLMLSPACCLYRKKELIDALYQGNLPVDFGGNYHGVGPDLFVSLLVLLRYPKFGVVAKPLCIFGSHDGSITTDANNDAKKHEELSNGYRAVRRYYKLLKLFQSSNRIRRKVLSRSHIKLSKRIENKIKLFFKTIGLRKKEVK